MNVIWVISDTLRRDHVGAYGNKAIHTPAMDDFAARAVRFDRHYISSFPTMPTRADYLTGLFTMSFMKWEKLPEDVVTLPELLSENKIETGAIVDTPFYVRNEMNYDRGFQTFTEVPGQLMRDAVYGGGRLEGADVRRSWRFESDCFAPQTFIKAMQWLDYHYKENFFLYVDVWDPHEPWDAPLHYTERYYPGFDGKAPEPLYGYWTKTPDFTEDTLKRAHAAYCGEVTMVDTWLGHFLRKVENMGLMENTAIIFTSDHGYYFGEHGGLFGKAVLARDPETGKIIGGIWSHSPFYEEVTGVPLIIYMPGVKPAPCSGLTTAVDLMPTVLDIMEQEIPSDVEGKSLLPLIKNPSSGGREYVISALPFSNAGDELRTVDDVNRPTEKDSTATVTTQDWTLLYGVEPGISELYHLSSDPGQNKNVIAQYPDKARELHQLLVKFMRETKLPSRLLEPRLELRL